MLNIKRKGDIMIKDFKEWYCDGHGQAIGNVRYNLLKHLKEHKILTVEDVNKICDFCSEIDDEYLIQWKIVFI